MLDKFYTKPHIVELCYNKLIGILKKDITYTFLEPSAGCGRFLDVLRKEKQSFIAYDLLPEGKDITQLDFLKDKIDITSLENLIVLGNPPFGKKSKIAIEFVNKAFDYTSIVAFILPLQFRKYSVQKNIREDASLVYDMTLPVDAFTYEGKDYSLRCCFQVWCINDNFLYEKMNNLRSKKPITTHSDFIIYQYNCTKEALKYFDYDWDFAVYRQGFLDYEKKFFSKKDLESKRQYIFFKASSKRVLENLMKIDFVKLSNKNTLTPGFGKADVIEEYNKLYSSGLSKFL